MTIFAFVLFSHVMATMGTNPKSCTCCLTVRLLNKMRVIVILLIASVFVVVTYIHLHSAVTAISISVPDLSYDAPIPIVSNESGHLNASLPTTSGVREAPINDPFDNHALIRDKDKTNPNPIENAIPYSARKSTFKRSGEPYDFAACLLMKDDNAVFPEWMAYHYQVLPLRHLIIGLDPFALTSPDRIVEEYRKEGMDITIWHEDDYIFNGKLHYNRQVFANDTHEAKVAGYLWRQRAFLTSCIQEFKRRKNVKWTLLVDTDEYLTYNHFHNESEINEVRIAADTM
jgi:hypothetical protein